MITTTNTKDSTEPKEKQIQLPVSLRDYFAAKALNAYLSDIEWRYDTTVVEAAEAAYQMADAMLKAREA